MWHLLTLWGIRNLMFWFWVFLLHQYPCYPRDKIQMGLSLRKKNRKQSFSIFSLCFLGGVTAALVGKLSQLQGTFRQVKIFLMEIGLRPSVCPLIAMTFQPGGACGHQLLSQGASSLVSAACGQFCNHQLWWNHCCSHLVELLNGPGVNCVQGELSWDGMIESWNL